MSEITREVPDAVQGKAKIIDFAAAKAGRLDSPAGFANRTVFETPETPAKVLRPPSAGENNIMRQLKNSKPFIIKKFLKIPIRDQPIVNRYMSCPAHNYPGSFSEVQDNSSIASI